MRHLYFSLEFVSGCPPRRPLKLAFSDTAPKRLKQIRGAGNEEAQQQVELFWAKAGLSHLRNGRNRHAKSSTTARAYARG
jgi:hypothetical protein